jgi:hypothetical protein
MFRAFLQLARLFLCVTMREGAFIAAKQSWFIHNICGNLDTRTASLGALTWWFPMTLARYWARCVTT